VRPDGEIGQENRDAVRDHTTVALTAALNGWSSPTPRE